MANFEKEFVEFVEDCETSKIKNVEDCETIKLKKFRKQQPLKTDKKEIVSPHLFLRNESLMATETIWFDPIIDPKKHVLKRPMKRLEGGVSFLLFAVTPENEAVELLPKEFLTLGTGFCIHSRLFENRSIFGDFPNWFASVVGLTAHLNVGVLVGSYVVDPHNHEELKVSLFNMGSKTLVIEPSDPIAEIVFNGCHVPNVAGVSSLSDRFEGVKKI